MKKAISLLGLTVVSLLLLSAGQVRAGGPTSYNISMTPSASSTTVSHTITVDLYAYVYRCSIADQYGTDTYTTNPNGCAGHGTAIKEAADPSSDKNTKLTVSGAGATLSTNTVSPNSAGHATFTVKSSATGTKNISAAYAWDSTPVKTIQVTFTSPTVATTTTPSISTVSKATPVAAPTAPKLAEVKIDGNTVSTSTPLLIGDSKPLDLSGKTVANGIVTLTIHSTPRTTTATADKNGNWSYSVSGLEPGNHYIDASVTDPKTKKTSPTTKLLSFTVTAAKLPIPAANITQPKKSKTSMWIAGGVILLLIVAGATWLIRKRLQKKSAAVSSVPAQGYTPTETGDTPNLPEEPEQQDDSDDGQSIPPRP